jgi:hypothetical protein
MDSFRMEDLTVMGGPSQNGGDEDQEGYTVLSDGQKAFNIRIDLKDLEGLVAGSVCAVAPI